MKKATIKLAALGIILCGSFTQTFAQYGSDINVVTTAVPFLRISSDARGSGMGDLGIATTPDVFSGFWNCAKTPFQQSKTMVGATYTPWLNDLGLNDVYLLSAYGTYKIDDMQALNMGLRFFNLGTIQFTDALGQDLNKYIPREMAFDLGYSRKLSDRIGLGIALRYINSNLASDVANSAIQYKAGNSVAGDIHFYQAPKNADGAGLAWGATLSNLGSKISYTSNAKQKDFIPANFGIGATYTKIFDKENKMTFGVDLNKLMVPTPPVQASNSSADSAQYIKDLDDYRTGSVVGGWFKSFGDAPGGFSEEIKEFQASLGAEYVYKEQFAFRAGYFYEAPTKGSRKFFSLGAGIVYNMFGLNFSYLLPSGSGVNRNPLSNTLRFSLTFDFDKK